MSRKFATGLAAGFLAGILAGTAISGWAGEQIRLVVNGTEVKANPPPVMMQGRVFVPVRFVAEALGVYVEWDPGRNTVIIEGKVAGGTDGQPTRPDTIKLNGTDTGANRWSEEDEQLFVPGRVIMDALALLYPETAIEFVAAERLRIGGSTYALRTRTVDRVLLYSLNDLKSQELLDYRWEPQTASLIVFRPASGAPSFRKTEGGLLVAGVNEELQFTNMRVTVTGVRYADSWKEFQAGEEKKFAIVTIEVHTGPISVNPLRHPVEVVSEWFLSSGSSYGGGSLMPGTVDDLRPDQTRRVEIGHVIADTEELVAVSVISPYPEDARLGYLVKLNGQ